MENHILDENFKNSINQKEVDIININKFTILYLLSFGLYGFWWTYKVWRFFKEKDELDIIPGARAFFSILFLHALFENIQKYAKSNHYTETYSSTILFIAFVAINMLSRLPDPFWLVSLLGFIPFMPPLKAYNYSVQNSDDYRAIEKEGFNSRQLIVLLLGLILWMLILVGIFM
ncbi:hypothetical protein [Aureispira anguillae]|uniref:DUF4234 domain-containing protein n=1 Tax=Aureispira anguillae TaxID=2864201 RepID=A0A916DTC1_9BACT|nr:hypothetical protein [Aureispira anguillae]BDS13119.1 hypothetical protein AsAng_0038470 [Aureispira anguillae]